MITLKNFCLLITLLISTSILAQRFEYGKVSEAEINEQSHPLDPEAPAAYLYKKGKIYFEYDNGWHYVYEEEGRIKIYTKDGFEYATVEYPIYGEGIGKNEEFSGLKAFTNYLEGNKIVKERVKSDAIFKEDFNEYWSSVKFTFPNVKEGVVLEYTFKVRSVKNYITKLPEFEFQDNIPVNFAEYTIQIPEYLGYKSLSKGYYKLAYHQERRLDKFQISYVPRMDKGGTAMGSHKTEHRSIDYTLFTSKYTGNNIPKIVNEGYVNNINNYITSITHELEWIKLPYSEITYYSTSWDDVAKQIYKHNKFGKELSEKNFYEAEIASIIENAQTNQEKVLLIFEFVKNKVKWNGKYGYLTDNGLNKAYRERTGNIADINLLLTSMLRHARIQANPVLVSTKSNGIPIYPTRTGFNYVICAVEIDKQIILLDASNPFTQPNILPEYVLNWNGQMVKSESQIDEINLMPNFLSKKMVNMDVKVETDGSITGKIRNTHSEQYALSFRQNKNSLNDSEIIKSIESVYPNMTLSDYALVNKTDTYKPIIESYNFKLENAYDKIGDKIYLQPMFFVAQTKNYFNQEKREFPVDFRFPFLNSFMISVHIPEGYKIESIPESGAFQLPDQLGEFKYMISENGKTIQLRVTSEIREMIFPADYYEILKEYFGALVEKQTEKIILSKN